MDEKNLPQMLSVEQVSWLVSMSVRTVWRMTANNKFPQPVRYNRKLVRWRTKDVTEWVSLQFPEGVEQ